MINSLSLCLINYLTIYHLIYHLIHHLIISSSTISSLISNFEIEIPVIAKGNEMRDDDEEE